MSRSIALALLMTFCFVCGAKAQALTTNIKRIEVDGKVVKKSYRVFFLSKDQWIQAERTSKGFIVPKQVEAEEYLTVLITFGKHKLHFSRIKIDKFGEDWIVGIDNRPFSDEFVRPEDAAKTKSAHYIQFEGTGIATLLVVSKSN